MRYQGSEAYSIDAAERYVRRQQREAAPSFEVVTGGGLDARARRGVSRQFVARVRAVLVAAAVLVTLGVVRVALTAETVSLLQENATLQTQISEARTLSSDLSIERSVLSSNARISRIATQNYGMVLPTDRVSVTVGDAEGADDDAATDATEADDAADATTDGEAAQTPGAAGEQGDMG